MESTELTSRDYCKLINSKRSNPDMIQVFYSMKIEDPRNTLIERDPQDNRIRVLVVPEEGDQVLVIFNLPDIECTVEDFLIQLNLELKDEIHRSIRGTYLVRDAKHNINYVVMLRKKFTKDNSDDKINPKSTLVRKKNPDNLLFTYPPSPHKGKITINIDDFKCLNRGRYLNDTIIDFYLKYLMLEKLSSEDRQRTYVFSSYFYSRLTHLSCECEGDRNDVSLATKQHAKVKRWTKDVNIFKKDFVVVPIHKNAHWFLAIICYPGLINIDESKSRLQTKPQYPCILIFDSIATVTFKRSMVVQDLKNYLKCEFTAKMMSCSAVSEDNIDVCFPEVPQQRNSSDCGLYLLRYAENFFKDFVTAKSFQLPVGGLKNWFGPNAIKKKREEIKSLLIKVMYDTRRLKKTINI